MSYALLPQCPSKVTRPPKKLSDDRQIFLDPYAVDWDNWDNRWLKRDISQVFVVGTCLFINLQIHDLVKVKTEDLTA